jgi:hypothetical protein
MKSARFLTAAAIAALAGQAAAQPILDGIRDDVFYGTTPIWTQNQPTSFGDNSGASCDNTAVGNPGAVQTGMELVVPLAAIGNPSVGSIKITAFINGGGHDFVSNQVLAGLPAGTPSAGTANLGEPRTVDFSGVGGLQFIGSIASSGLAPTVDGRITTTPFPGDPASYGAAKATQTCRTGFGDATLGLPGQCNGSELDGVFAVVNGTNLHILITGNFETNGNKLEIFIDSDPAVGQNQITANNPTNSFGGLQRMGPNADPQAGPVGPGLKFDAGFTADYWLSVNCTFDGGTSTFTGYVDYAQMGDVAGPGDPGVGYYLGSFGSQTNGTLTGGDPAPAPQGALVTVDNSNIAGVPGACPPPSGNPNTANGSEIDSVYGKIFNNKLYLLVTGNVNSNFSKLNLFFDATSGGQNRLLLNNPQIDVQPFADMCDDGSGNGLTFDKGFNADYWFSYANGNVGPGSPPSVQQYVNSVVLRTDGLRIDGNGFPLDYGSYDGGDKATNQPVDFAGPLLEPQTGLDQQLLANYAPRHAGAAVQLNPLTPATPPSGLLKVAFDNSNTAGVTASSATGAAAVTTGLEMEIDLAELACVENSPATCPPVSGITSVKVAGFLSGNDAAGTSAGYQQMANQVLGGLPSATAPGGTRTVNFSQITGNQFITITAGATPCYANCDGVGGLTANDFICFLTAFNQGLPYANCDNVGGLTANDFICFVTAYNTGCP